VPVYLPTTFPGTGGHSLYAEEAKGSYLVDIGFTAACSGADACHYGEISGGRPSAPLPRSKVRLRKGVTGYFTQGTAAHRVQTARSAGVRQASRTGQELR
jgi:hypothetical protein